MFLSAASFETVLMQVLMQITDRDDEEKRKRLWNVKRATEECISLSYKFRSMLYIFNVLNNRSNQLRCCPTKCQLIEMGRLEINYWVLDLMLVSIGAFLFLIVDVEYISITANMVRISSRSPHSIKTPLIPLNYTLFFLPFKRKTNNNKRSTELPIVD